MSHRDICPECGQMYSLHVGPCPPTKNLRSSDPIQDYIKAVRSRLEKATPRSRELLVEARDILLTDHVLDAKRNNWTDGEGSTFQLGYRRGFRATVSDLDKLLRALEVAVKDMNKIEGKVLANCSGREVRHLVGEAREQIARILRERKDE